MNYYERHLGDYARDTAHLTMLEHGAYGLLLDRYYATEQGIPKDQAHRVARARTKEERLAVDVVLTEFFTLDGDVWVKGRVQEEITKAQSKIKAAQENGKRGGRPKQNPETTQEKPTGLFLGSKTETQKKAHQTPDTILNSEANASDGKPSKLTDPNEIIFGYGVPMLVAAGATDKHARSFLGGLRKGYGDDALIGKLRECVKEKPLQPLEWLAAAMPPGGTKSRTPKPENFESKNYGEGITAL